MNLRCLIFLNPLIVDKISKKFLYHKDSGFLYTCQLIRSLPTGWRISIMVPKGVDRSFFPHEYHIDLIEYDYSTSIHQNRYHFNRNIFAKAFPYTTDIDVVFNHQPEVSASIRCFFENQRRESPIIVNYFHWIDCAQSRNGSKDLSGYIYRQIDGVMNADLTCFHNYHAQELFNDSALQILRQLPEYRVREFHPMPTKFGHSPIPLPDKKIILFNHRLNATTGWKQVLDACVKMRLEGRDDFVLWFTDESNLKAWKALKEYPWVIMRKVPFKSYGFLLNSSHFSVCNTTGYATWNMAVLDSIENGTLPLVADTDLYRRMFEGTAVPLEEDMARQFSLYLDRHEAQNNARAERMTMPAQDSGLPEFIEAEIRRRVSGKTPAKYDRVVDMIISKPNFGCSKKEYVNEFWSFHANSNFQLIRWKLLTMGFKDAIRNKESIWYAPEEEVPIKSHTEGLMDLLNVRKFFPQTP